MRTDISTKELKALYFDKQLSIPEIEVRLGCTKGLVKYRFQKANLKLRTVKEAMNVAIAHGRRMQSGEDSPHWGAGSKVNDDLQRQIAELYRQGLSIDSVGKQLGLKLCTIWYWVRRLGIRRDKSELNKMRAAKSHPQSISVRAKISQSHKGLRPGPETCVKLSESHRGKTPSLETRQKMSQARQKFLSSKAERDKIAENMKRLWSNSDYKAQRVRAVLKGLFKRPTKPEKRAIDIIDKNNLPYKYTGDGSVVIAGLSPDFTNCNGAKKLIEIFGVTFHDPNISFRKQMPLSQQETYRKAIYASLGFDCLVLWDDEMGRLSDEDIADTIKKFTKSRHKPTAQLYLKED